MLERPAEVRLWAIGEGIHVLLVLGFPPPTQSYHHPPTLPTQSLQTMHSLPIGLGPLSSMSQETLRLPIITSPAETVEGW